MSQNVLTISGIVYDPSGANTIGPYSQTNTNGTQPEGSRVVINTNTTTTVTVPTNSILAYIKIQASAGTVTIGSLPCSLISAFVYPILSGTGSFSVITSGINTSTDYVQVVFM